MGTPRLRRRALPAHSLYFRMSLPEPYYQDEACTIYHGDCREMLPSLETGATRLAFTDPPYNSGLAYGNGTDDRRADYWEWLAFPIAEMLRLSENVLVKHSALKLGEFTARWPGRILVWYKPFSSGFPHRGVATHWEPIHLLKGRSDKWSKDVFVASSGNTHRDGTQGHPAQFPESVAAWVIDTFSLPGDVVLDPFVGSGTVLKAAKNLNRCAIGIEIEERYCEIAAQRLAQEVLLLEV